MFDEISKDAKVNQIAKEIRALNKLDENQLYVRFGSWSEIIFAGRIKSLILPKGYYPSTYTERGKTYECITNRGNTVDNGYWTFIISPR